MDDQQHEMILDAGQQFYSATERDKLSETDIKNGGQSWIDMLFMPYMFGEYYFQDKPDSIRHRVTWDLVADMFWQGFYFAKSQAAAADDEGGIPEHS